MKTILLERANQCDQPMSQALYTTRNYGNFCNGNNCKPAFKVPEISSVNCAVMQWTNQIIAKWANCTRLYKCGD